jgi:pyruvate kinase
MKIMFIAVDTPLEYSDECEAVNWLMSSGDGIMIARDAPQLETATRLNEISSFIASSREEFCNQTDEFCLHYHDSLVVLASCAVTTSLTTSAAAIFILSENDLLAYGVYFHSPKCVVIPIIKSARIARQLNILDGFIPLCLHNAIVDKKVSGKCLLRKYCGGGKI